MNHNSAIRLLLSFYLVTCLIPVESIAEVLPKSGTFFERILTVQSEKTPKNTSIEKGLSIPYSRIDIAIDNSLALVRFIQIYRNSTEVNQGYALNVPLQNDTTISQFNLWDRGQRYQGAIEDRRKAEKIYSEVTGDELPSMDRDPGLVRAANNRFEIRVFPIFPNEDKQIELVTHHRLPVSGDQFELKIPLEKLLSSTDARHSGVLSNLTEISVYIKDTLPITDASVKSLVEKNDHRNGSLAPVEEFPFSTDARSKINDVASIIDDGVASLVEKSGNKHQRFFSGKITPDKISDLVVAYKVALPADPVSHTKVFSEESENYFLSRILARVEQAERVSTGQKPGSPFYFGVWRNTKKNKRVISEMEMMDLEMFGLTTFQHLNKSTLFHASWRPLEKSGQRPIVLSKRLYPSAGWMSSLQEGMGMSGMMAVGARTHNKKSEGTQANIEAFLRHLDLALQQDCKQIYLLFDHLPKGEFSAIAESIRKYSKVPFLLIMQKDQLPEELYKLSNVSYFVIEDGWKKNSHFNKKTGLIAGSSSLDPFSAMFSVSPAATANQLWEKLPDLDENLAFFKAEEKLTLEDLRLYENSLREQMLRRFEVPSLKALQPTTLRLIWLTGKFKGAGKADLVIPQAASSAAGFMPGLLQGSGQNGHALMVQEAFNSTKDHGGRFIAATYARERAQQLALRLSVLQRSPRNRGNTSPELTKEQQEKIKELREQIVSLSRQFSFMTTETAFIALPDELQEKYGVMPQIFETQDLYNLDGMTNNGAPEPHWWLLLIVGLLAFTTLHYKKMHSINVM